ncbi:MAG: glutamate racemase [Burkholderiales bacterium]|nr:glutamate racemase [Burkholderiales bacterium]
MNPDGPIGVFDSGVGGLSVWREIVSALPNEDTIYFADQQHVPYGPRSELEIRAFSDGITRFLLERGCKAVVVACNTASAAALKYLRDTLPHVPTIGMEPAVKPAAAMTKTGVVGIMATPATFQGRLFKATAGRHASNIRLINQVCDGLADHVEAGDLDGAATERLLRRFLDPILEAGADTIVLACTHYPFVIEPIRRIAGPGVAVIDPAPAIARHLGTVLTQHGLRRMATRPGQHAFITSGDPQRFESALLRLTGVRSVSEGVRWQADTLTPASTVG